MDEPSDVDDADQADTAPRQGTDVTEATAEDDTIPPQAGIDTAARSGAATSDETAEPTARDEDTAPDGGAEATAEGDDTEPGKDAEPDTDDDGTATDNDAQAAPDGGTKSGQDTEPATEDDGTATDNDAQAAPDGGTKSGEDTEPATEDDGTATDNDAQATPEGGTKSGQDAEADDSEPGDEAGPAPEGDGAEPDKDTERPAEDKSSGSAAADEPGDATPAESSESTRTVALRPPKDVAGSDRTMTLGVADLPPVEPRTPPASPIDLLAQLTNTPPPPNTPARTALRRVKIWSPLVALLVLVALVVQVVRPLPEPSLVVDTKAASFTVGGGTFSMPWPEKGQAAVMVAGSGSIGAFGEQKPVPTASVAKIMTAYVILREHPIERDEPGPTVTVDARTVEEGNAKHESRIVGLRVGQKYSLQDMLKMLMIPSGNNVARLLARWATGAADETAFVRKMNEAARSLGMKNTTYTDPSGLDKGTVSTAVDQLKLAEAVMRFDSFRMVVALPDAEIPGVGRIYNNNSLTTAGLSVRGIKTGSNTPAGGTLSWAAYKTVDGEDRLILGTMMDQHVTGPDPNGSNSLALVLANSKKVIKAVRDALTSATAVRKGQVVGHVDDGLGGRTPVVATKDLKVVGTPGQKLKLTFREGDKDIVGGMKAGTVVGELTLGGVTGAERVPVALQSELQEPSLGAKLTRIG
ncbi:serine hydrolase [Streptomyces sp. NPDC007808]|uniref:serine hydrolase n=1 Tax=Streptomyces sp. NPDC007808 TaxID=3364779 RepID=UPI00368D44A5